MMACRQKFLSFETTEQPAWRKRQPGFANIPSISDMVAEIVEYRSQFLNLKRKKKLPKNFNKDIDLDFLINFLFNIQIDEGIGLQTEGATKEVITNLVEDWPDIKFKKILEKLETYEAKLSDKQSSSEPSSQESSGSCGSVCGKRCRQTSRDACYSESSNASSDEEGENCLKYNKSFGEFSPPNYPSIGNTECIIEHTHERITKDYKLRKQIDETTNLYKGYKHLAEEIDQLNKEERQLCLGLIDVDNFVLGLHKTLMNNVMDDSKTIPGHFSINERSASFKGDRHTYPRFATEVVAYTAIQTLVDKYADILEEIRKIPDEPKNEEKKIKYMFKCASLFLFGFLTLHPFGDGNGRLARLLCSYSLLTFSPFLTPIFNVFSPSEEMDYVDALVNARQGLQLPEIIATHQEARDAAMRVLCQEPSDLCSLLIESNYFTWSEYLRRINDKSQ